MGHYTQFRFKAELKDSIIDVIDSIVNKDLFWDLYEKKYNVKTPPIISVSDSPNLPINHEFGECPRWHSLFCSTNFDEDLIGSKFNKETKILEIHSEFKNYNNEIYKFTNWITPHCEKIYVCDQEYIG